MNPALSLEPYRSVLRPGWVHHLHPGVHAISIAEGRLAIHPDLPEIATWGYGVHGHVGTPGPQLEVFADHLSVLRFENHLSDGSGGPARLPFLVARRDAADSPDDSTQNHLGIDQTVPVDTSGAPIGWTTVHLHGGHTRGDFDGFPDNMNASGHSQVVAYDNTYDNADLGLGKVGQFLWYHDHAMNGTRYHVYAGLAGPYIVRDRREARLGLPTSPESGELLLLLQDRNVALDAEGSLRLLHKTTGETAEFFGPLNVVNGKLWPRLPLRGQVYRLRLLNGCNARSYRLHLVSYEGGQLTVEHQRVLVIGTEGGLLWRASPLASTNALTLTPAERLDVLLDLTGLPAGAELYLINSAEAPFTGTPTPTAADLLALVVDGDRPQRNPFPAVMRIDIDPGSPIHGKPKALFDAIAHAELNPDFRRLVHEGAPPAGADEPAQLPVEGHAHRVILLAENPEAGHLFLHEVVEDPAGKIALQLPGDSAPKPYRVEAFMADDPAPSTTRVSFYDRIALRPLLGQWQVWRFVNTTGDTHPIHIHQAMFQPLGDAGDLLVVKGNDPGETALYNPVTRETSAPLVPDTSQPPRAYEDHEKRGWKDVIRIDPGHIVSVAIRFDIPGRYVYHCHVLEHEDTEMMRPFVVTVKPMDDGDMHM